MLELLQPVDAADHGGLARAGGAADHDALALPHRQVDIPQGMVVAVPLVHAGDLDRDFLADRHGIALGSGLYGSIHGVTP
ncbi:hypothetical protein D9M69_667630 [compost metagenome]